MSKESAQIAALFLKKARLSALHAGKALLMRMKFFNNLGVSVCIILRMIMDGEMKTETKISWH